MDRRMRMGRALARAITPLALIGATLALIMTPALAGVTGTSGVAEPTWLAEQSQVPTGADVSYPQCGGALPFGQAFGVVGVNGGRASSRNPCLGARLGGLPDDRRRLGAQGLDVPQHRRPGQLVSG